MYIAELLLTYTRKLFTLSEKIVITKMIRKLLTINIYIFAVFKEKFYDKTY